MEQLVNCGFRGMTPVWGVMRADTGHSLQKMRGKTKHGTNTGRGNMMKDERKPARPGAGEVEHRAMHE